VSTTYAIPDLHGRRDLLDLAVDAIARRTRGAAATVVLLGDYVNKGPASAQVIDRLLAGFDPAWQTIFLKGNHDGVMLDALLDAKALPQWLENGGAATLRSYAPQSDHTPDPAIVPDAHRAFLERLRTVHVDGHRVYVHAGVDPALPLDAQDETTLLTKRYAVDDESGYGERHVVHGHHPFRNGPRLLRGRTDLDTLAWQTGRLVVGVFDDERPGGPVDLLEVIGPSYQDV
jgi:calcineurin-like phosphoesterase family protein